MYIDRDGNPVGEEMTLLAEAQEEGDKTEELEDEEGADEEDEEDEEEDEGRTVKVTMTIVVDKGVLMDSLQVILFNDILGPAEDVKEVVSFEWEDVK